MEKGQPGQSQTQGEDRQAHVLHAGVGEKPLVFLLSKEEEGRKQKGKQAKGKEQAGGKGEKPRCLHDGGVAEKGVKGHVEEGSRKQGRSQPRGLGVGIGKPGLEGKKPHLGTEAHQEEGEGHLKPLGIGLPHQGSNLSPVQSGPTHQGVDQDDPDEPHGNAHAAQHEVLPGGLQGPCPTLVVDQKGRGQEKGTRPVEAPGFFLGKVAPGKKRHQGIDQVGQKEIKKPHPIQPERTRRRTQQKRSQKKAEEGHQNGKLHQQTGLLAGQEDHQG